jgi:hypothetical protein
MFIQFRSQGISEEVANDMFVAMTDGLNYLLRHRSKRKIRQRAEKVMENMGSDNHK